MILSLYFLVHFYQYPPKAPYMVCFTFGSQLFGTSARILNGVFFQTREDFTRLKKKSNASTTAETEKQAMSVLPNTSDGRLQRFYDALEVGFAANRGVGW